MRFFSIILIVTSILMAGCHGSKQKPVVMKHRPIIVSTNAQIGSVSIQVDQLKAPSKIVNHRDALHGLRAVQAFDERLVVAMPEGLLYGFNLPPTNRVDLTADTSFGTNGVVQIPSDVQRLSYIGSNQIVINGSSILTSSSVIEQDSPTALSSDGSWGLSLPRPHGGSSVYLWNRKDDQFQKTFFLSRKPDASTGDEYAQLRVNCGEIIDDHLVLVGKFSSENHEICCMDRNTNILWKTDIGYLGNGVIGDIEQTSNGLVILNRNLRMISYFTRDGDLVGHLSLTRSRGASSSGIYGGIEPVSLDLGFFYPWYSDMSYNTADGCLYFVVSDTMLKTSADGKQVYESFIYRIQGL